MTNYDVIDTRDLVEELEELNMELEDFDAQEEGTEPLNGDDDRIARREAITKLFEELTHYAGDSPEDGITLIADSYFTEYAQDLASDIGVKTDESWPHYCIDWEWAARDLQTDYTSVEFDGVTYWYR